MLRSAAPPAGPRPRPRPAGRALPASPLSMRRARGGRLPCRLDRDPLRRRRRRLGRPAGRPHHAARPARRAREPTSWSSTARTPAGGIGITPKHADELFAAGADVITLGNHTYRHREVWPYLEARAGHHPAGELPAHPAGPRHGRRRARRRHARRRQPRRQPFMEPAAPALLAIDDALREVRGADHVLVDMHAEATSEKVALGWYLDGRVTAVVGTHTHVPTRRARAPRRHRLHHRRRDDRRARRRDRRAPRAVDRGHAHAHAAALRRVGRGPVAQRRGHPLPPGAGGRRRSSRCCARPLDARARSARGAAPAPSPAHAEVVEHQRDDVAQRPLLAGVDRRRARPAPQQRAEGVDGVQRAVRAAADVVRAAPVEELVAGLGGRRAPRRPCGSAAPPTRAPARPGSGASRSARPPPRAPAPRGRPPRSTSARAGRSGRRAARSAARRCAFRTAASPSGWSVMLHHDVDALVRQQDALDARDQRRAARRGRARRPARRASSGTGRSPRRSLRAPPGGQHGEVGEGANRSISSSTWDCEWSEHTITAWSSRNASTPPAACMTRSSWRSAAASEVTCASGPCRCECVSLSGRESRRKSNRSCSTR